VTARPALAKVAIARKELGLDEETYRAVLTRLTGQDSAKACTDRQLGLVLDEFKAKGWKPHAKVLARNTKLRLVDPPAVRKARALWISLHQLGVVRDRTDAALESFAVKQIGKPLREADAARVYKLIEALKAMAERAGWDQSGDAEEIKARLAALLDARGRDQG
jgi:phage gp16-like protein